MKKNNVYNDTVEILKSLLCDNSLSRNERDLFHELEELVTCDKLNKIVVNEFLLNNKIVQLIADIDKKIFEYEKLIKKYNSDRKHNREVTRLQSKINQLKDLKFEIYGYNYYDVDYSSIISKCVSCLNTCNYHFPKFFDRSFIKKDQKNSLSINDDVVTCVYDFLSNEIYANQLEAGVDIYFRKKNLDERIALYQDALKYKKITYKNMNDIFLYNSLKIQFKELTDQIKSMNISSYYDELTNIRKKIEIAKNSIGFSRLKLSDLRNKSKVLTAHINSYHNAMTLKDDLARKISEVERRLKDNGFDYIMKKMLTNNLLHSGKNDKPESYVLNFPKFLNEDDLNNYFTLVERNMKEAKIKYQEVITQKNDFDKSANLSVLLLLNKYFETAKNSVELKKASPKNGILPMNALTILRMISIIRSTRLCDMDILPEELAKDKSNCYLIVNRDINQYINKYMEIIKMKGFYL